jgi:hypothetical protein
MAAVDFDTMKKLRAAENTGSTGEVWLNDLAVQWFYWSQEISCIYIKYEGYLESNFCLF